MSFPFEVPFDHVLADMDRYVDIVIAELESEFLTLPKGEGFIEYPTFERGYETLKRVTNGFRELAVPRVLEAVYETPISLIVLRTMLGFTPPELAYVATQRAGVKVGQTAARSIDRNIRLAPLTPLERRENLTAKRIEALVRVACELLEEGPTEVPVGVLHRLEKADTKFGIRGLQSLAELGVPYAMLLYERFLGRPFASHRDSVSELIGDVLEVAIEEVMHKHGISYRKTKRAEQVQGFDQAPDFIIPDEFSPQVVIEAKITEDDGTARDKVTRIQHLRNLAMEGKRPGQEPRFQVVACISGRGFRERRGDMKKLLKATCGKVFALSNISHLIEHTQLRDFQTRILE